jgi:RNA polymerase sigma factor (sigma-70 family)
MPPPDDGALIEFLDQFGTPLMGYLVRRFPSFQWQDAEDVFQETLLTVELKHKDGTSPFSQLTTRTEWEAKLSLIKSYLFGVAFKKGLEHRRWFPPFKHLNEDEQGTATSSGPADTVRAETIRSALEKLCPVTRQVVTLKYYSGLSNQEIATAMRQSLGWVKTRLHRACAELRELLDITQKGSSWLQ